MFQFLLILSLYLPFQIALNPAPGVDLASLRVIIPGLFLAWVAKGLRSKKLIISNNIQSWALVVFLFLNLFSIFFAQNFEWSLRKLAYLLSIFPLYFVAAEIVCNKERLFKVINMLLISGLGVALLGLTQFVAQFFIGIENLYVFWSKYVVVVFLGSAFSQAVLLNPSWLVNISGKTIFRAISIFPDPHMFSFYLGLLLPLALGMFMEKKKWFYLVSFFVFLLVDFLTFSRAGYIGLLGGAIVMVVVFWGKINRKTKMLGAIVVFIILLILLAPGPVSQRFLSSFDLREGSNVGRLEMWLAAKDVIGNNFFGVGIGNYPLEVKPTAGYREPIYAHNTYLDIGAETGIINIFIWLTFLFSAFLVFLKKSLRSPLFLMASISIVIFATHSIFETGIYSPVVLSLLLIIIGFSNIKDELGYPDKNI